MKCQSVRKSDDQASRRLPVWIHLKWSPRPHEPVQLWISLLFGFKLNRIQTIVALPSKLPLRVQTASASTSGSHRLHGMVSSSQAKSTTNLLQRS